MIENITNTPADEIASTTPATDTTGEPVTEQASIETPEIIGTTNALPADYLADGYKTADGRCDHRYVGSYAVEIAAKLAPMEKEHFRAFYREVDLNAREAIDRKQKILWMLTAHAYENLNLGRAPEIFYEFMKRNAEHVTDNKSYNAFRDHMEAIYCYMN